MLNPADLQALWLTLQLAAISTLLLLLLGIPLAWWLARSRARWRFALEALIALPLVLPPTVLGFYLLLALGSRGPLDFIGLAPLAGAHAGPTFARLFHQYGLVGFECVLVCAFE